VVTSIYIDEYFAFNLAVDLIALYICGFCVGRKGAFFRNLCAAAVGSLYTCVIFFSDFGFFENLVLMLIVSAAMIFIAFKIKAASDFFKTLAVFYILNMLFGGGVQFAAEFMNTGAGKSIIFGITAVLLFGGVFFSMVKKSILKNSGERELILYYCGNEIKLRAFTDTGNSLIDPISRASVVIVSQKKLENIVDKGRIAQIKNPRIIPCKTVTNESGILYGFRPDKLTCDGIAVNATVALCDTLTEHEAVINPLTLV
jgi:stage II sporulation protein GA (sporulation sigma-E factor processing peptidase)